MSLRKVLFIAYNFPPHGGAGVQRSLKFVKYLPEFGWQPLVVSAAANASRLQDASLCADIPPSVAVFRVPAFSVSRLIERARRRRLEKLAVALNLLLQIPDAGVFWARAARRVVGEVIEREQPAAIYTTSGPYSAHLLGKWVKTQYGLPWLADFRDPWSANLLLPYLPGYRALNRRLERGVLAAADRVTCVSQTWLAGLQNNLGGQREKFIALPNGYDESDIQPEPLSAQGKHFVITHLGSFYRNRKPTVFLQAIEYLRQSDEIPLADLCVRFIGKNSAGAAPSRPPYEMIDYLPHHELGRYRAETNVFLLLLDASPANAGNLSGKIYEYIASNRPILAVAPEGGEARALITETRSGVCAAENPAEIAAWLVELYRQWREPTGVWQPDWEAIHRYTRRNLTGRLAQILNHMAGESP